MQQQPPTHTHTPLCQSPSKPPTTSHLIKEVSIPVRGSPLRHEAGKRHALQHLGEKVIFCQSPLPKEGCLEGARAQPSE